MYVKIESMCSEPAHSGPDFQKGGHRIENAYLTQLKIVSYRKFNTD